MYDVFYNSLFSALFRNLYILFIHRLYMTNRTTINIDKAVRDALKEKRKFKRETYDEIIARELKIKIKERL